MAATYQGLVSLDDRQHNVEVRGSPGKRIVIVVNGKTVFDKTPFVPKTRIDFQLKRRPATVEWRAVGLLHEECYVEIPPASAGQGGRESPEQKVLRLSGTREFLLQERDSAGQLQAPLDPERRFRLQAIALGVGCVFGALVIFGFQYVELRGSGGYHPKLLILFPFLLVLGTAVLFTPLGFRRDLPEIIRKRERIFIALGGLLIFGTGWLFQNWFIATFRK